MPLYFPYFMAAVTLPRIRTPSTTLDWCYKGAFVITTVAMTALSFHSWEKFSASCAVVCFAHVVMFNRAVRNFDFSSDTIQNWTAIASLVTSCVAVAAVFRSIPTLRDGFLAAKTLDLSEALFYLMIFPFIAGYGIPFAQSLYDRGLELLQIPKFEPMELYLSQSKEYKNLVSLFLDKCAFAFGVIAPDYLEYLFFFTPRVQVLTIPFCNKELQEARYKDLLKMCEMYPPKEARLLWETALHYLFIQQQKWHLLPGIVQQSNQMTEEMREEFEDSVFPLPVHEKIVQEQQDIQDHAPQKLANFQTRVEGLRIKLNLPQNPPLESEIDKEAAVLVKEIETEYTRMKVFTPDLENAELKKCMEELKIGETGKKVQAIRSKINAGHDFDREQETWDYFLSLSPPNNDEQEGAQDGNARSGHISNIDKRYFGYIELLKLFGIAVPPLDDLFQTQGALHTALTESGIETMGAFVEKILNNDPKRLKDPIQVLKDLEIYLKDDRQILYRKLAGKATEKANALAFVAARVTYLAVMTLAAVAPLWTDPVMATAGFIFSLPYYASPSLQDILAFLTVYLASVVSTFRIAARRPFLDLFRSGHSALKHTYDGSSHTGKLRILGTEMFYGYLLTNDWGAVAAGASLGREVWGRIWPQNVRRQHFI